MTRSQTGRWFSDDDRRQKWCVKNALNEGTIMVKFHKNVPVLSGVRFITHLKE